jgi:SAM-dependent methyltransferase
VYVERRERLAEGAALEGSGKRAAFALYYGVQHLLLVRAIVDALGAASPAPRRILDLGCGTGSAGAAWALAAGGAPAVEGIDRSGWAAEEATRTFSDLGLRGRARKGDAARAELGEADGIVLAYTVNELPDAPRAGLLQGLLATRARLLVVEPLARKALGWWDGWAAAFAGAGGRADEWRFPAALPDPASRLGKAAGLDTRLLTGRTLYRPAPDRSAGR